MTGFEYKVVPAPMRGLKGKGIKGTPARFANALQTVMNEHGADGWEYQRTDTLPVEERQGLTGKTTSFQNMLVFRRALVVEVEDAPEVAALIEDQTDVLDVVPVPEVVVEDTGVEDIAAAPQPDAPVAQDFVGEIEAETPEAPITQNAQNRVSETLTAPFAFPWNKRNTNNAAPKDDDTHPS